MVRLGSTRAITQQPQTKRFGAIFVATDSAHALQNKSKHSLGAAKPQANAHTSQNATKLLRLEPSPNQRKAFYTQQGRKQWHVCTLPGYHDVSMCLLPAFIGHLFGRTQHVLCRTKAGACLPCSGQDVSAPKNNNHATTLLRYTSAGKKQHWKTKPV